MNEIELEKDIIILSTRTIQKLFSYENWADVVALYLFYSNQLKIQWANQHSIVCVWDFVKESLHWWDDRFKKAKRVLREIWLIEDMRIIWEDGKIAWSSIKINSLN